LGQEVVAAERPREELKKKLLSERRLKALAKAREARWGKGKAAKAKNPRRTNAAHEVPF